MCIANGSDGCCSTTTGDEDLETVQQVTSQTQAAVSHTQWASFKAILCLSTAGSFINTAAQSYHQPCKSVSHSETFVEMLGAVQCANCEGRYVVHNRNILHTYISLSTQHPEVVEDFVRNFLVQMNMTRTAECFQTEWWVLPCHGVFLYCSLWLDAQV